MASVCITIDITLLVFVKRYTLNNNKNNSKKNRFFTSIKYKYNLFLYSHPNIFIDTIPNLLCTHAYT